MHGLATALYSKQISMLTCIKDQGLHFRSGVALDWQCAIYKCNLIYVMKIHAWVSDDYHVLGTQMLTLTAWKLLVNLGVILPPVPTELACFLILQVPAIHSIVFPLFSATGREALPGVLNMNLSAFGQASFSELVQCALSISVGALYFGDEEFWQLRTGLKVKSLEFQQQSLISSK